MKRIQVSKKDVKLLLILLSLIVLYVTYQFVYTKKMDQAELLNTEITSLENRLSELKIKVNDGDIIRAENESMLQEFDSIVKSYGNGASEEKSIMMVQGIEAVADMSIDTVSFNPPEYFFNGSNTVEGNANSSNLDEATSELAEATGDVGENTTTQTTVDATQLAALNNMSGYRTSIGVTFRVSYEGFKQCIDYINNFPEKSNVGDITLSYDSETGNLNGTMTINMYHLIGDEIEYQQPVIGGIEIGTDNIFGTIEIPIEENSQE